MHMVQLYYIKCHRVNRVCNYLVSAAENLLFMQRGGYLVKVRDKNDKFRRFFKMDPEFHTLTYKSHKPRWHRNQQDMKSKQQQTSDFAYS